MTQKEIEKFLANTKVYVNGMSKEIQEKLFSLGYNWCGGSTKPNHTNEPFIFIYDDMNLTYDNDMSWFIKSKNREITAEQILSLELTEPSYRPFKDKEECWQKMLKHQPFGWIADDNKCHLISSINNIFIWLSDNVCYSFEEAFNIYNFTDGTPFGIKEE